MITAEQLDAVQNPYCPPPYVGFIGSDARKKLAATPDAPQHISRKAIIDAATAAFKCVSDDMKAALDAGADVDHLMAVEAAYHDITKATKQFLGTLGRYGIIDSDDDRAVPQV